MRALLHQSSKALRREGGKEGGREGRREGGREGGKERGREGGKEVRRCEGLGQGKSAIPTSRGTSGLPAARLSPGLDDCFPFPTAKYALCGDIFAETVLGKCVLVPALEIWLPSTVFIREKEHEEEEEQDEEEEDEDEEEEAQQALALVWRKQLLPSIGAAGGAAVLWRKQLLSLELQLIDYNHKAKYYFCFLLSKFAVAVHTAPHAPPRPVWSLERGRWAPGCHCHCLSVGSRHHVMYDEFLELTAHRRFTAPRSTTHRLRT
jgi:hypothetical protein